MAFFCQNVLFETSVNHHYNKRVFFGEAHFRKDKLGKQKTLTCHNFQNRAFKRNIVFVAILNLDELLVFKNKNKKQSKNITTKQELRSKRPARKLRPEIGNQIGPEMGPGMKIGKK